MFCNMDVFTVFIKFCDLFMPPPPPYIHIFIGDFFFGFNFNLKDYSNELTSMPRYVSMHGYNATNLT